MASGDAFSLGSPQESLAGWIRQTGADARAIGYVLDTFVATPADALREVPTPTLGVAGDRDSRSATAGPLADLLPEGRVILVTGHQCAALGAPEFTAAVLHILG
jgi:hypothetical protein